MRLEHFLMLPHELDLNEEKKIGKQTPRSTNITPNAVASVESFGYTNAGNEFSFKAKTCSERFISGIDYTYKHSGEFTLKVESSRYLHYDCELYGSIRKEKEWKRTLACKLFEEHHSVEGCEKMDLLWEIYESESVMPLLRNNKNKKQTKGIIKFHGDNGYMEKKEINRQLHLGTMKRSNLVKISKAIIGTRWLNYVSKYGKKVHNNGDRYY